MIINTAQKMKFSIKDFFSNCDQIRRKLRIRSHLLNKYLMENLTFCAVKDNVSEEYLEPYLTSKTELFAKLVDGFHELPIFGKNSILVARKYLVYSYSYLVYLYIHTCLYSYLV